MNTRKLGTLEVSELGFGCMNLATNYGPAAPIDDAIKVIREAHAKVYILRHGRSVRPVYERDHRRRRAGTVP